MRFIILDRDGVINFESVEYIKTPDEWLPIPGSLEAIALLNRAGFEVMVATNQSGVGRGYYDLTMLDRIHGKLQNELAKVGGRVSDIFFCPHAPHQGCACRKPEPGLLYQIQAKYRLILQETFFIGDSWVDVKAAKTAGCQPLLVLTGNGQRVLSTHPELTENLPIFPNLFAAVQYVLSITQREV